jgi:cell division protein FtsB
VKGSLQKENAKLKEEIAAKKQEAEKLQDGID